MVAMALAASLAACAGTSEAPDSFEACGGARAVFLGAQEALEAVDALQSAESRSGRPERVRLEAAVTAVSELALEEVDRHCQRYSGYNR